MIHTSHNTHRLRYLTVTLVAVASLTAVSCSHEDNVAPECRPITLMASIADENGASTRSVYIGSSPTRDNPLSVAVWSSTTRGSYPGSQKEPPEEGSNVIDYHNTTNFFSGSISQLLDKRLFYPQNDNPVYFVAFCPNSQAGWSMPDGDHKAKHTFTGNEDMMFAPEAVGSYNSKQEPLLKFYHILTWLRVRVTAEDEDAAKAWGVIRSVSVISKNTVTIDTSKGIGSGATDFTTEGEEMISMYVTGAGPSYSDTPMENDKYEAYMSEKDKLPDERNMSLFPGLVWDDVKNTFSEIPVGSWREQCYVLCAPVEATSTNTAEYELVISTEKRSSVIVPVTLTKADGGEYEGPTQGHRFDIELTFKLGDKISTVGTVLEWANGGMGQGVLGD